MAVAAKQRMLAAANAALLLVNLLPVLPLDGGRALRAFLFPRVSRSKVTAILCYAGAAAGVLLSALGVYAAVRGSLNPTLFLAGAYLSRQALRERESPALLSVPRAAWAAGPHAQSRRQAGALAGGGGWYADAPPGRAHAGRGILQGAARGRTHARARNAERDDVLQRCLGENPYRNPLRAGRFDGANAAAGRISTACRSGCPAVSKRQTAIRTKRAFPCMGSRCEPRPHVAGRSACRSLLRRGAHAVWQRSGRRDRKGACPPKAGKAGAQTKSEGAATFLPGYAGTPAHALGAPFDEDQPFPPGSHTSAISPVAPSTKTVYGSE